MRKLLPFLICAALASCADDPTASLPHDARSRPNSLATAQQLSSQPAEWWGYWAHNADLWVHDKTLEVGIGTHEGTDWDFDRAADMGMRLVRYTVMWEKYDSAEAAGCKLRVGDGKPDGCYSAGLANAVYWAKQETNALGQTRGTELVVIVHGSPNGTVASHGQAFADFMGKLAARFPEVRFWQILNEPDAGFWGVPFLGDVTEACSGNREAMGRRYAQLLQMTYPKIKAANPSAWVLTAGLTGNEGFVHDATGRQPDRGYCPENKMVTSALTWNFLRGLYAGGGKPYFDFLAIHAYGQNPWAAGSFQQKGHLVNQVLVEPGISDANRPMWVTEFGATALDTSDRGRLLDPAQRPHWRTNFDNEQKAWWENALAIHSAERNYYKILGFQMAAPGGGAVYGPTPDRDFLDPDTINYGAGIFRYDVATRVLNRNDPRPTYTMMVQRAGANRAAADIDASGGRVGTYSLPVYGRIPRDYPFHYEAPDRIVIENLLVKTLVPTVIPTFVPLRYAAHTSNIGWMGDVYNDQVAGTVGQARQMEALRISKVELPADVSVCYQAHVSGIGWMAEVCDGGTAGTTGQSRQMEAVRIRVVDPQQRWRVCYQAYGTSYGWGPEVCDGDVAGMTGQTLRMEAVRVRLYRR